MRTSLPCVMHRVLRTASGKITSYSTAAAVFPAHFKFSLSAVQDLKEHAAFALRVKAVRALLFKATQLNCRITLLESLAQSHIHVCCLTDDPVAKTQGTPLASHNLNQEDNKDAEYPETIEWKHYKPSHDHSSATLSIGYEQHRLSDEDTKAKQPLSATAV